MDAVLDWPREYLRYIDLFNEGEYFDAHEVLEDLWVIEVGRTKTFYKGLIQVAVAICHWERGNRPGTERLWHSGRAYLATAPTIYEGLDVGQLLNDLGKLFRTLELHQGSGLPELDRDAIPHVALIPGARP